MLGRVGVKPRVLDERIAPGASRHASASIVETWDPDTYRHHRPSTIVGTGVSNAATPTSRFSPKSSDRAADRWREDYGIAGIDGLDLYHLYPATAWLGEELPEKDQDGRTPLH